MPETVGEQLKKAREARNLTLEQVFQATRINPRYLKGLEEDLRASLPSTVQAKGFLRLYAAFLNLPVQDLVDQWDGKLPPEPLPPAVEAQPENEPAVPPAEEAPSQPEEPPAPEIPIVVQAVEVEVIDPGTDNEAISPVSEVSKSQAIFTEIGAQLQERREMLGLSLVDVENFTRLRQHYLRAMESGRMDDLPSLVQGRGMLNNYARFLELDSDAILLRFAEALQTRRIERMPAEAPSPTGPAPHRHVVKFVTSRAWKRLVTPDLLIGGAVILFLLGFLVWGAAQVTALRAQQAEPTAPPIANVLAITSTASDLVTATPTAPAALPPDSEVGNVAAPPPAGEVTPTTLPVIGDAPLQVYVVAQQRAWLKVTEDGKVAFTGRVTPGNAYPFSGEKQIELISGDAAALQIFYNQQDLGPLGLNGQMVSLIFSAEGVITPTPSASTTPTATIEPSVTARPTQTPVTPTVTPFIP